MSLVFVAPGHPMGLGHNRLALYSSLGSNSTTLPSGQQLTQVVAGTLAWWDASSPAGLLGPGTTPETSWGSSGTALIDLTGNGNNLVPFSNPTGTNLPVGSPHLSGLLGGVGFPVKTAGLLQPALDPGAGWQVPSTASNASSSWTWCIVWSRPNWRQGTSFNANPITLLTIASQPVLQIDSNGGAKRLLIVFRKKLE